MCVSVSVGQWAPRYTHHVLDDLVLAVLPLHLKQVVAEVKEVEATLLSQQHDDGASRPVQPVPEALPGRSQGRGERGEGRGEKGGERGREG